MFVFLFSDSEAMEVKSSTSISALDAISEALEPEDVDMMSQVDILKKYYFFEKLKIQSNLVIWNFLVILKLFLNTKCSL